MPQERAEAHRMGGFEPGCRREIVISFAFGLALDFGVRDLVFVFAFSFSFSSTFASAFTFGHPTGPAGLSPGSRPRAH
jgi:hypothetical protein